MSGKHLGAFRSGDRSEYLASFALSRVAFVNPFPRQEDFGIADFLCVLTKQEGRLVLPEGGFYVQVKAAASGLVLDSDALKWISEHMDHPLLVCIAEKEPPWIRLYSCWPVWLVLFPVRTVEKVTLVLDSPLPVQQHVPHGEPGHETVFLGPPIAGKSLDEIEADPAALYECLRSWIALDATNIARRRVGRIAVSGPHEWRTNSPLGEGDVIRTHYFYEANYLQSEADLAPILTALAHNYRHDKQKEKLQGLCAFLAQFDPHSLDDHGRKFAQGELKVE